MALHCYVGRHIRAIPRKIMNVNHELAHHYIAALSCTKEGAELVQALEAVRYYHSEGRIGPSRR